VIAELEGYQKLAKGEALPALELFAKATRMSQESLARAHLAAPQFRLRRGVGEAGGRAEPQTSSCPWPRSSRPSTPTTSDGEAKETYRKLEPMFRQADKDTPIARRLAAIVQGWKADGQWSPAPESATDETIAATPGRPRAARLAGLDALPGRTDRDGGYGR